MFLHTTMSHLAVISVGLHYIHASIYNRLGPVVLHFVTNHGICACSDTCEVYSWPECITYNLINMYEHLAFSPKTIHSG